MHHVHHLSQKGCQSIPFDEFYRIIASKVVNCLTLVTYGHFYFFVPSRLKSVRGPYGNQGIKQKRPEK